MVVSGKRDGGSSGGCVGTATKTSARDALEVTDMRNTDDDIIVTICDRQNLARGRDGAGGKSQDKVGVRKVGLSLLPS